MLPLASAGATPSSRPRAKRVTLYHRRSCAVGLNVPCLRMCSVTAGRSDIAVTVVVVARVLGLTPTGGKREPRVSADHDRAAPGRGWCRDNEGSRAT